jgi:hypothetical protein
MEKNNKNNKKKSDSSPMNRRSLEKRPHAVSRKFLLFMVAGSLIAYLLYKSPPLATACTRRTKFTIFKSVSLNFILIFSSTLKICARSDLFSSGPETSIFCAFVVTHL